MPTFKTWIFELTLTTLWMAAVAFGQTMGGWVHILAVMVVAMVFIQDTPLERKLRRFRFAR
jgi:uncharacterized protein (DUF58 family)